MRSSTRILIVQDEPITAMALEAQLRGFGHEVVGIADSRVSALSLFQQARPDVVLIDCRLANGDSGLDTAARLLALRPVAVVFLTTHGDECTFDAALALSPMGFLFKPVLGAELRAMVEIARRNFEQLQAAADHTRELTESRQRLSVALSELSRQAREDPLTGIGNRRCLDEALRRECGRLHRQGGSLALLLIDVDWCKRYNDCYGHPAGDECLRLVAGVISASAARPADVIARYGGEEFAVLLPDTAMRGALSQMDRILDEVRDLAIPHAESPIGHVTVSIGAAVASAHTRVKPEQLVNEADGALYRAKRGKRDCSALVVVGSAEGRLPTP